MSEPRFIRTMSPFGFRNSQWAEILTTCESEHRDCYLVRFPDGFTDFWVVDDPDAQYEFANYKLFPKVDA